MSSLLLRAAGRQRGKDGGAGARRLSEGPRPGDRGTRRREDELTVGQCGAVQQGRRKETGKLLSPGGTGGLMEASHLPACRGVGITPQHEGSAKQTIICSQQVEEREISAHALNPPMTPYLEFYFASLLVFFYNRSYFKCSVLRCQFYTAKGTDVSIILCKFSKIQKLISSEMCKVGQTDCAVLLPDNVCGGHDSSLILGGVSGIRYAL